MKFLILMSLLGTARAAWVEHLIQPNVTWTSANTTFDFRNNPVPATVGHTIKLKRRMVDGGLYDNDATPTHTQRAPLMFSAISIKSTCGKELFTKANVRSAALHLCKPGYVDVCMDLNIPRRDDYVFFDHSGDSQPYLAGHAKPYDSANLYTPAMYRHEDYPGNDDLDQEFHIQLDASVKEDIYSVTVWAPVVLKSVLCEILPNQTNPTWYVRMSEAYGSFTSSHNPRCEKPAECSDYDCPLQDGSASDDAFVYAYYERSSDVDVWINGGKRGNTGKMRSDVCHADVAGGSTTCSTEDLKKTSALVGVLLFLVSMAILGMIFWVSKGKYYKK